MGVHGLWELLAPVGRRVSVETLAGKKLAIDASIWMIQFMKAMRDEKGEMVRNAHILGFFRRICKLLYLRTKPVFVFDGGTPALKRRTVIARRRQRENAQAKIRKTAEKLLLNHLKAIRLKELAADLERQRQNNDVKGKKLIVEEPSIEQRRNSDIKGKKLVQDADETIDDLHRSNNQEELDAMLAASLAVEENEDFIADASTSGAKGQADEVYKEGDEDEDEDEEMILPEMHGKVDPAVLAALPPSMQLDLLVQMREKLMAENRKKYQQVKKAPARFSELQIQAYRKTVAFRRDIDEVQKSAAGKGIGGVQTSRIASEANREFIFSSSFTGDKQALASAGKERTNTGETHPPSVSSTNNVADHSLSVNSSSNVVNEATPKKRSGAADGPTAGESRKEYHDDVETYLDERGRRRVSRVRALGIRMTRDLQRNLDLMKEIEQEKAVTCQSTNNGTAAGNMVNVPENTFNSVESQGIAFMNNDVVNDDIDKFEEPPVPNGTSIEISFEDISKHECGHEEDTLFADLVAGVPVLDFSTDDPVSAKQFSYSPSDSAWEEGVIDDKSKAHSLGGGSSDDGEIEWEDGSLDIHLKLSSCPEKNQQDLKKGDQEEEEEFQEAIRRSLEDMIGYSYSSEHKKDERLQYAVGDHADKVSVDEVKQVPKVCSSGVDAGEPAELTRAVNVSKSNSVEPMSADLLKDFLDETDLEPRTLDQDNGRSGSLAGEFFVDPESLHKVMDADMAVTAEQLMGTNRMCVDRRAIKNDVVVSCGGEVARDSNRSVVSPLVIDSQSEKLLKSDATDAQQEIQAAFDDHSRKSGKPEENLPNDSIKETTCSRELMEEMLCGDFSMEKEEHLRESPFPDFSENHEVKEDILNEEIFLLNKEREELGSEQRKLERNAESVSSEMFAECQELLQMFGLPYIIAPMEAEAQCAYMEISNLVDGVVTDDSDAFLFGARSVYKNIFDDRKYVETYLMKDIEDELGLDREKLIRMALLLGSDYTEGVSGIGIVNAIEVVNAFPEKDGLRIFREWIESPDPSILGKLDVGEGNSSQRKGSMGGEIIPSSSSGNLEAISQSDNDAERIKQIFMDKHRNVSKNWHIPSSFPSDAVILAYDAPQVDKSTEPFSWGKPDLFVLRKLCWEKFGWGASKSDDVLLPVLKEYNKHETQLRLEAFYTFNERFAKIRSKRIKKAVKGITGDKSSKVVDETNLQHSKSGKKRKGKPSEYKPKQSGEDSIGQCTETEEMGKQTIKHFKGKKKRDQIPGIIDTDSGSDTRKDSYARGKQRGRGGGRLRGRGKKRKSSCREDTESSHSDDSCGEKDVELQFEKPDESHQVRRSGRLRKVVNYSVCEESDIDKEMESFLNEEGPTVEPPDDRAVADINEPDGKGNEVAKCCNIEKQGISKETEQIDIEWEKMDNTRIDDVQINDPINDPSNPDESSNDYLQFGGGFCVEEDDGKEINAGVSSPTIEMRPETCNVGSSSETPSNIVTGTSKGTTYPSITQLDGNCQHDSLPDDVEHDSGNAKNVVFLRAMPNLRRKKRKI